MANRYAISLLSMMTAALVGCQAQSGTLMVDRLPPQNFNGPAAVQQAYAAPPPPMLSLGPVYVPPPVPQVKVAPASRMSVPVDWTPAVRARAWKWIIIHHTATATGGAAAIDRWHKARGWDGLGYDFVVGNGTDTREGQVEVGFRWKGQLTGAHTKTLSNEFNETGIGICLVGNFDVSHPSVQQLAGVSKLVGYLMKTYNIPADHILGHGQTKATDCPGRYVSIAEIKRRSLQTIADSGEMPAGFGAEVASFHPGQEMLEPVGAANTTR